MPELKRQKKQISIINAGILMLAAAFPPLCAADTVNFTCDGATGLTAPAPVCSVSQPCENANIFNKDSNTYSTATVTTASDTPLCRTTSSTLPYYNDGNPYLWTDDEGVSRYTCVFYPSTSTAKLPALIYFHGGWGEAADVYDYTLLRDKAVSSSLSPSTAGFILASVQGRNLNWPSVHNPSGRIHDYLYRVPSQNPDFKNVDHIIDYLVREKNADPLRLYVSGWSNGSRFAQEYAIFRHTASTPGGNYIAAAAVYATNNPFGNLTSTTSPSCEMNPYPAVSTPLYLLNRHCDAAAPCNEDLRVNVVLPHAGATQYPESLDSWRTKLNTLLTDQNLLSINLITGFAAAVSACASTQTCTYNIGLINHMRWPNGIFDGSGIDWEQGMLQFLKDHPSLDISSPTVPQSFFAAAVSSTQINLSWSQSTDNVGIAGYKIFRGGAQIGSTTAVSYADTNLVPNTTYKYRISSYDAASNNSALSPEISAATPPQDGTDNTAPICLSGAPSGTLVSGTTQTIISLATDENAVCRYSITPNTAYSLMVNNFTITGSKNHSTEISGLTGANAYDYYIRCRDSSGNTGADDYLITFSIGRTISAGIGQVKIIGGAKGYINPGKNERAVIKLKTGEDGVVTIKIYTLSGQLVWDTSLNVSASADASAVWNATNKDSEIIASGIYIVHIKGAGIDEKKKIAVVK